MSLRALLTPILDDDRIVRGLDDAEARVLVEWLVGRAEGMTGSERQKRTAVRGLCDRARGIALFVMLWCYEGTPSAALQLAATERFMWPLPTTAIDPCDLLNDILAWEDTPEEERENQEAQG